MSVSVPSDSNVPALPKGQLLYAVGDIHGRLDLLRDLLQLIEDDAHARSHASRRTLVFLGDYVDRGPDSSGVVADLIARPFEGFDTHFLKGNHEAILLDFLEDPLHLNHWLMNGGQATMDSYGVDTRALTEARATELKGFPPLNIHKLYVITEDDQLRDGQMVLFIGLKDGCVKTVFGLSAKVYREILGAPAGA